MFPDEDFGAAADRAGNYLATERDKVEGYWPPIPDHWVAYGLAETVQFPERNADQPLTKAEFAYVRSQASLFGGQVRWVSQQAGPWGRLVRGTHIVRGGGYGVVGEALTGFWRVAEADSRLADLRKPIAERAKCMAGLSPRVCSALNRPIRASTEHGSCAGSPAWTTSSTPRRHSCARW